MRNGRPSVAVSNVEGVDSGVYELKIDLGPTSRVYFGKDGERVVIPPDGISKRQGTAIAGAQQRGPSTDAGRGEQTIYHRAQQDAGFRKALLTEAMNAYLGGRRGHGQSRLARRDSRDYRRRALGRGASEAEQEPAQRGTTSELAPPRESDAAPAADERFIR